MAPSQGLSINGGSLHKSHNFPPLPHRLSSENNNRTLDISMLGSSLGKQPTFNFKASTLLILCFEVTSSHGSPSSEG